MLSPYPPPGRGRARRLRVPRALVVLAMLAIVLAMAGWALFGPVRGARGTSVQTIDPRYASDAAAQRRDLARLRAQVDEQNCACASSKAAAATARSTARRSRRSPIPRWGMRAEGCSRS